MNNFTFKKKQTISNAVEDFKEEIKDRISSHRHSHLFQPNVTYREVVLRSGERVVDYYVDLPREERYGYVNNYFEPDRDWVENHGNHYGLLATLYCKWHP